MTLCASWTMAQSVNIENIGYQLNESDGTAILKNGKSFKEETLIIPEKIEHLGKEYTVTSIASKAFYSNVGIKKISIANTITEIGEYAFCYCTAIDSVTISSNVNLLSKGLFYACTELEAVSFGSGNSTVQIGDNTFYKCSALKTIGSCSIKDTVGDFAFANCAELQDSFNLKQVSHIGEKAFYNCSSIKGFAFNSECDFGSYAFYHCLQLKEVSLTDPKNIGDHCFTNCTSLTTFTLNQTSRCVVGEIGDSSFTNCTKLDTFYYSIDKKSTELYRIGEDVFGNEPTIKAICVNNDSFNSYNNIETWEPYVQYILPIKAEYTSAEESEQEQGESAEQEQSETTEQEVSDTFSLKGKRIIVFGDSKAEGVGNKVGKEYRSWAYYLQEEHGCVVTNAAVGGTHLTPASLTPQNNINGLGVYSLIKAWGTGDYSLLDASMEWAHSSKHADRWDHVEQIIKNTSATDYDIVCIEAGTNDWNNRLRVIGSWDDSRPIYNYTVSLKEIIGTLFNLNPKLYILIIPPIVRQMELGNKSTYSDYYLNPNSELYLYDVSQAMIEVAYKCGADTIDAYNCMGFTYENWTSTYSDDGTHPNEAGYRIMANKIGDFLLKNYANPSSGEAEHSETTVIYDNAQDVSSTFPAMIFDLNGRSMPCDINDLHNGFYIINGQKYYIKSNLK